MTTLKRQLQWLIAIRMVVVTSVVLPYFLLQLGPGDVSVLQPSAGPPGAEAASSEALVPLLESSNSVGDRLLSLALITYAVSLIYIALLRLFPRRDEENAYVQFVGDLVLATILVYYFGGIQSPFSILYLLVIAVATTMLRRRSTVVATLAFLLYAGLQISLWRGWLSTADGTTISADPAMARRLGYNLAIHFFGFYAVNVLTWWLTLRATRAEKELEQQSERLADLEVRYRDLVQSLTTGLITTDLEHKVTTVNRSGCQLMGLEEEAILGRSITDLGFADEAGWSELTDAARRDLRVRADCELPVGDDWIFIGFSVAPLRDADRGHLGSIVIFQDLTNVKRLEEEVRIKDRMAAIGSLAAGVAHEIGNPLAAISGSVQMLQDAIPSDGPSQKLLAIVDKESQRLKRTIQSLLQYARPREPGRSEFDIGHLLTDHFQLLKNSPEVGSEHHLELDLSPENAIIRADADQVSQVFWNLTKNALRAMPEGGRLSVRGLLMAPLYVLDISDTGKGMSERERSDLFHPYKSFFDGGTGLGMAIVYRIVEDHRGRISISSHPGEGTTVRVELPVADPVWPTADYQVLKEPQ